MYSPVHMLDPLFVVTALQVPPVQLIVIARLH